MVATTPAKARKIARKAVTKRSANVAKKATKAASGSGVKKAAAKATKKVAKRATPTPRKTATAKRDATAPVLLSGGNPQIPKGHGDAPVQAYIAAMPGWKREIGRRIDTLVARAVPGVHKAVKWNSPFYGVEDGNWFLSLHCFTRYVKVTFFRGTSLDPVPPGESKTKQTRYLDIHEGGFDEAQFVDWVKQASRLPGERM